VIWVYGICDRPDMPLPRRRGLAQAPLDGVREGGLVAVISRHVHPPGDPALDTMWVHERVVERIMADRTVLPMRFGSKLPDEGALRDILAANREAFLAALDRVRGRLEVGVRAMQPLEASTAVDVPPPMSGADVAMSGRAYLEAKLQNGRRTDHAAGVLHEPLAKLAIDARRQPPRAPLEILRASYLIDAVVLARFRGTVERLQRTHPGVAILCTGPWPPYSFVTAVASVPAEPTAGGAR